MFFKKSIEAYWQNKENLPMCVMAFKGDDVMPWYEQIKNGLKRGEIYSHKELTDELKILKPDLADSTYH